jgi:hypothetical protein
VGLDEHALAAVVNACREALADYQAGITDESELRRTLDELAGELRGREPLS